MSELPEDDPRVQDTLNLLMRRLGLFIGRQLDNSNLLAIRSLIEHTRNDFIANHGYAFPPLVPLILPGSQFIAWYRQDLDDDEIRIKILNLLREFHVNKIPVSAYELSQAMKIAWPWYKVEMEFYRGAAQVTLLN